jgi:hypothetical protein
LEVLNFSSILRPKLEVALSFLEVPDLCSILWPELEVALSFWGFLTYSLYCDLDLRWP